jgi:hypothetical protein
MSPATDLPSGVVYSAVKLGNVATLTIPAGAELYFDPGTALESTERGARLEIAEAPERLGLLTSAAANPAAGDWKGLLTLDTAGNAVRKTCVLPDELSREHNPPPFVRRPRPCE